MPNGKPGDHPYRDIVRHDIDVHTEEVSNIVRHLADTGDDGIRMEVRRLLWQAGYYNPTSSLPDERYEALTRRLYSLAGELRLSENYPYESPLQACLDDDEAIYSASVRRLVREIHREAEDALDSQVVRRKLSGILWGAGWEPDQLDELEAQLQTFKENRTIHRFQRV